MKKLLIEVLPGILFLSFIIFILCYLIIHQSQQHTVKDIGKAVREIQIEFFKGYNDTIK